MKKGIWLVLVVLLLFSNGLAARDLFEVGLGVAGVYDATGKSVPDQFWEGMGDGANWTIGMEMNIRLSVIDLSLFAMPEKDTQKDALLFSSASLSIPIVTNLLYVHVGGGVTTPFLIEEPEQLMIAGQPASETTFLQVINSSMIHMRGGIDVLFGPATLSLFYVHETEATVEDIAWSSLWEGGKDRCGMMLRLALF